MIFMNTFGLNSASANNDRNGTWWKSTGFANEASFIINRSGTFSGKFIVDNNTYFTLTPTHEFRFPNFQNWIDFGFRAGYGKNNGTTAQGIYWTNEIYNVSVSIGTEESVTPAKQVKVAVLFGKFSDTALTQGDFDRENEIKTTLKQQIADYHLENSYGSVSLDFTFFDNGSKWFSSSKSKNTFSNTISDSISFAQEIIRTSNIDISGFDIVTVVYAGNSFQLSRNVADLVTVSSPPRFLIFDKPTVIVAEFDTLGLWAHEIGHTLRPALKGGLFTRNLPDLDNSGQGDIGTWGLMGIGHLLPTNINKITGNPERILDISGTTPDQMSTFSRLALDFLTPKDIFSKGVTVSIKPLEEQIAEGEAPRFVSIGLRRVDYLLEYRKAEGFDKSLDNEFNKAGPKSGNPKGVVVVYKVVGGLFDDVVNTLHSQETKTEFASTPGLLSSQPSLVNLSKSPSLIDIDVGSVIRFSLAENPNGTKALVKIEDPVINGFKGAIIEMGNRLSMLVPRPSALPNLTAPTLSLHAYTEDGRHIGKNFVTGNFDSQIEGALFSGPQPNGHEWILIPENETVVFTVSTFDVQRFVEANT